MQEGQLQRPSERDGSSTVHHDGGACRENDLAEGARIHVMLKREGEEREEGRGKGVVSDGSSRVEPTMSKER